MSGPNLSRRRFIQTGAALAVGSVAGCVESRSPFAPPVVSDRPDAVYIPSHFEGMQAVGTAVSGPLEAALTFSYPHRFWLVTGTERSRVRIKPDDSLHLMVTIWDRESGTILSGAAPRVRVESTGSIAAERIFWPMLSQRMGVHYGDNLQLPEDGTYSVTVEVPPTSDWTSPAFGGRLDARQRFEFTLDWRQSDLEELAINMVADDRLGTMGALEPMQMADRPLSFVTDSLPGESLGSATADGMTINASLDRSESGGPTLLLTASTPHNQYAIPMLGPVVRVDGARQRLRSALDPALGMHYRADLPADPASGPLSVEFSSPPQVVRHEGYETAFMDPGMVTFELG